MVNKKSEEKPPDTWRVTTSQNDNKQVQANERDATRDTDTVHALLAAVIMLTFATYGRSLWSQDSGAYG